MGCDEGVAFKCKRAPLQSYLYRATYAELHIQSYLCRAMQSYIYRAMQSYLCRIYRAIHSYPSRATYSGHSWAEPDVQHLRELMRRAVTSPDDVRQKGTAARRRMVDHFGDWHASSL